jgi:transposase
MLETGLFTKALGLQTPWYIENLEFSKEKKRLDINISFEKGCRFACPICGDADAKPYDSKNKSWRHLDFFQYQAYLNAKVPRVQCVKGCGTKRVDVPWARLGTGFTLLFEAMLMPLCKEMPIKTVANLIGEQDTRIWRIIHHYVEDAREKLDFSQVTNVGMDETASKRGHHYVSIFCDMDEKRIMFATKGKDKSTVADFKKDFELHKGNADKVEQATCDMSPSFIAGVKEQLPNADITFDRFHLMKLLNDAVDEVRREEVASNDVLKKTRYIWLKNPNNLTISQQKTYQELSQLNLKTIRAYQIRLNFQEFFKQPNKKSGEEFLKKWYYWATHSKLKPIIKVAKTFKRHWSGIINWFESHLSTGLLEGMNSLIQSAKSRARGYRSDRNLVAMCYLIGGKLEFDLPT